jgi:hypothetical protein
MACGAAPWVLVTFLQRGLHMPRNSAARDERQATRRAVWEAERASRPGQRRTERVAGAGACV